MSDRGRLGDHPGGVAGLAEPLARRARRCCATASRSRMTSSCRKFSCDEVLQALAELVLAPRDQRRVRDRQPERVLEQRGHREPVRDRTDHARLGAGVDVAPEAATVEGEQVDHGGEHQQRHGEGAHPAQPAPALGVGRPSGSIIDRDIAPVTLPDPPIPETSSRTRVVVLPSTCANPFRTTAVAGVAAALALSLLSAAPTSAVRDPPQRPRPRPCPGHGRARRGARCVRREAGEPGGPASGPDPVAARPPTGPPPPLPLGAGRRGHLPGAAAPSAPAAPVRSPSPGSSACTTRPGCRGREAATPEQAAAHPRHAGEGLVRRGRAAGLPAAPARRRREVRRLPPRPRLPGASTATAHPDQDAAALHVVLRARQRLRPQPSSAGRRR